MPDLTCTIAIDDAALRQVVWRDFDVDVVAGQNPNVMAPQSPGNVREDRRAVLQLDREGRARKNLPNGTVQLQGLFLGWIRRRHFFSGAPRTPRRRSSLRPAHLARRLSCGEAVPAVDRAIVPGLERNLRRLVARRAGRREHLALRAISARISALRLACIPAVRAASRLIGEAFVGVKLLLAGRERERR